MYGLYTVGRVEAAILELSIFLADSTREAEAVNKAIVARVFGEIEVSP